MAVTVAFWSSVTMQVPVPEHPPPLHPPKSVPDAVSVTEVPILNEATQVVGQSMPVGFEVTVPVPTKTMERVWGLSAVLVTNVPLPKQSLFGTPPESERIWYT